MVMDNGVFRMASKLLSNATFGSTRKFSQYFAFIEILSSIYAPRLIHLSRIVFKCYSHHLRDLNRAIFKLNVSYLKIVLNKQQFLRFSEACNKHNASE